MYENDNVTDLKLTNLLFDGNGWNPLLNLFCLFKIIEKNLFPQVFPILGPMVRSENCSDEYISSNKLSIEICIGKIILKGEHGKN